MICVALLHILFVEPTRALQKPSSLSGAAAAMSATNQQQQQQQLLQKSRPQQLSLERVSSSQEENRPKKLTLSVVDGTYAILRLDPNNTPPDWLWESDFYSLTKTKDELSIVCDQTQVSTTLLLQQQQQHQSVVEPGWGLFKVEGPLEFGRTGILHELTEPLAKAGISMFTISTYDTDYILVKKGRLFEAGYQWILEGHHVHNLPKSRTPQDGDTPVVTFERDDMIQKMIGLQRLGRLPSAEEETYGIVVVAGWVPSDAWQAAYNDNFLPAVQKCFYESDWNQSTNKGREKDDDTIPNVYLYPSTSLHVTVATLRPFFQPMGDEESKETLKLEWTDLVRAASLREDWPRKPLQLVIDSAQIGKKAGILLWNELTGGLDMMRVCLEAELEHRQERLIRAGIDTKTFRIPTIMHSTFLRFHQLPETPGQEIQQKFQKYVKDQISTLFPDPIIAVDAKVVCERIPYMHILEDKNFVFRTMPF